MSILGFRTMDEMIGMASRLNMRPAIDHWKARGLDYTAILKEVYAPSPKRCVETRDHRIEAVFDRELIDACGEAIVHRRRVSIERQVRNVHRSIGTMLGSEVTRQWGGEGLPEDTIEIACAGSAGQDWRLRAARDRAASRRRRERLRGGRGCRAAA